MLVATRDDGFHAHPVHFGPTAPRTLVSRFTGGVQLLGSLVGIPLALIGGYSTYHVTFSPEAKCQALRANIVSVLDKNADATTLRLLVQRDVATFERECGAVDSDAAIAFRTLLASEKASTAVHRVAPPAKVEKGETAIAERPAKVEKVEKTEKIERREPIKREAVRHETPVKEVPAKEAVVKLEQPKQLGAPPQPLVAPPTAAEKAAAPPSQAEKAVEPPPRVAATAAAQPEKVSVDANWVASVREALRESASRPVTLDAAPTSEREQPTAPINIPLEPKLASGVAPERTSQFLPPADVGPGGSRPVAPRPPAPIPDAN